MEGFTSIEMSDASYSSCLSLATEKNLDYSILKTTDTLRIFLDEADDFDDAFGDGWTTLSSLEELELEGTHVFDEYQSAFAWLLKILQPNIRMGTHLKNDNVLIYSLFESAIASSNLEVFEFILDTFSDFVDIRAGDHEKNLLITCLHHREYAMARCLVQRGADLHAEGYYFDVGDILVCLITYALFSFTSFFKWRKLLKMQSVNLEDFIASAIK
jgi:hypothetical protein